MATKNDIIVGLILSVLFIVASTASTAISNTKSELKLGFYKTSCPNAETIIRSTVDEYISRAPSLAAPILRLYFHDCFVGVSHNSLVDYILTLSDRINFDSQCNAMQGCDALVLLNSTTREAEKDAIPNLSLR
ncbi:peroxidase 3-like [Cryptomeria japonica]|uniref:peroxidase 3-like n=1 Tax=Cryptomeria japonica TaxID=3369 RepID=UPI0027D9FBB3|nr:peroxidase 3-like [Cryptomeria japonica]